MAHRFRNAATVCAVAVATATLTAQLPHTLDDALRAIFERQEFEAQSVGPIAWLDGGARYTAVRPGTSDLVAYDTATGRQRFSSHASAFVPPGAKDPMDIDEYAWSSDKSKLLLFTNTRKVWRANTRGDYWVLDLDSNARSPEEARRRAPEASLMFAKFSPDGTRVAYVRAQNLYVEDLASGRIRPAHHRRRRRHHQRHLRLGQRGGVRHPRRLRWSPDGRRDRLSGSSTPPESSVHADQQHRRALSARVQFPYPKAGNDELRGPRRRRRGGRRPHVWMKSAGRPAQPLHRRAWSGSTHATLVLQQLNRLQNRNDVLLADAATGHGARVFRDEVKAGWTSMRRSCAGSMAAGSSLGSASATAGGTSMR